MSNVIPRTLVKDLDIPIAGRMTITSNTEQIIIKGTKMDGSTTIDETIDIDKNAEVGDGFGFFTVHYSHNCSSIGHFELTNCVFTAIDLLPHNLYVDPNGGRWENSTSVSTITGIYQDTRNIPVPIRDGYTFVGWTKTGESGTMSSLTGDAVYTFGEDEETDDRITAQWMKIDASKQSNITTGKVVENQEITYTITAVNTGTVEGTAIIKDAPPPGTTFVANSIKINGAQTSYTQQNLANGIRVQIPEPLSGQTSRSSTLSFRVRVNKSTNNTLIKNTAQYQDVTVIANPTEKNTNEVNLKYVEPIISQTKSYLTQNKQQYVVQGEKVTYTIKISNDGGQEKDVSVKDNIPQGTTFVNGSVKINGVANTSITANDLKSGVNMKIPAETRDLTLSFEVIVNDINDEDIIRNIATVDNIPTNEVTLRYVEPIITKRKEIQTENKLNYVVKGEKIKYTIVVMNAGGIGKNVVIKDIVPTGTTLVPGSIKLNAEIILDAQDEPIGNEQLKNGLRVTSPAKVKSSSGSTYEPSVTIISFEVTVNDINDEDIIRNIASVDNQNTNEVTARYVEPIITQRKEMETEHNLDYVVQGEKIKYTIEIMNAGGLGKDILIKDIVPNGTTLIPESIKLNDELILDEQNKPIGKEQLENGIMASIPKKVNKNISELDILEKTTGTVKDEIPNYEPSITTISFEVTVEDIDDEDIISNIAIVDNNETNEVSIKYIEPIIDMEKVAETEFNNDYVVKDEKIIYSIVVRNSGSLLKNVKVKDIIPEGTTFVDGSIKVNGEVYLNRYGEDYGQVDIEEGISIVVPPKTKGKTPIEDIPGQTILSFEVKVNDIDDEDIIKNIAIVDEEETNIVEHKYIEPIISQKKEAITQYKKDYVVGDERIIYNILIQNDGSLEKEVIVKDKIPKGAIFVKDSILVDGEEYKNELDEPYSEKDLEEGIVVIVPPKEYIKDDSDQDDVENDSNQDDNEEDITTEDDEEDKTEDNDEGITEEKKEYIPGKTIVSFEVIVNRPEKDTDTAKIINVATVDDEETNEVINEVYPFNMKIEKTIKEVFINNQYQDIGEGKLMKTEIVDKEINKTSLIVKYKIIVTNTGKVEGSAVVEDIIPKGYTVAGTNPAYWTNLDNTKLQTKTEIIQPGESKELEVVLVWQNRQDNFGTKINKAKIVKTSNESNAKETTIEDNISEATIIMGIVTGKVEHNYIIICLIAGMILIIGTFIIKKEIL